MTDKEREIMGLMYDLQVELHHHQGEQIVGLKHAVEGAKHAIEGAEKAIDSCERSHAILAKLMKATGELMGVH